MSMQHGEIIVIIKHTLHFLKIYLKNLRSFGKNVLILLCTEIFWSLNDHDFKKESSSYQKCESNFIKSKQNVSLGDNKSTNLL